MTHERHLSPCASLPTQGEHYPEVVTSTDDASAPSQWWPAPLAHTAIDAAVQVPGSKSMTNRALILASLSDGPSTIRHALRSRDTELMIYALRSLGVEISVLDGDSQVKMTLEVVPHFLGSVDSRSIDVVWPALSCDFCLRSPDSLKAM